MGCHTWFYKKVDIKTLPNNTIKFLEKVISSSKKFLKDDKIDLSKKESILSEIKANERIIDFIKNGKIKNACHRIIGTINHYDEDSGEYWECDRSLPHNVFRIFNRGVILYNKKETMSFIIKKYYDINFSDNWDKRLIEFWNKYPDGLIYIE